MELCLPSTFVAERSKPSGRRAVSRAHLPVGSRRSGSLSDPCSRIFLAERRKPLVDLVIVAFRLGRAIYK
ncbi:hypothetical protein FF011L_52600 [Roseimaritima multifibrata]|uniref:Uncharacterized protein n=1 Tax=Roseimaritima multifibrata TaxID=1930274 RepID=A0A517MNJ5_9BACT|nr:hypothetical protein FF011L_52600 [Roseimaritima multifibrata]